MYDIIIVGGGIAGLYCAYKLPKHLNILLLEKYTLGGKVDTYHDSVMTVEAGAARFSKKHVLLFELIHELGLASKVKKLPEGEATYISNNNHHGIVGSTKHLWHKVKMSKLL